MIHNISLPPGEFGGPYIDQLFTGTLNPDEHPYFTDIVHLRVSAHCLIRRDGEIIQYVPFDKRAWHAGVSVFAERERCNDFSIGIELEGTDVLPFTAAQYRSLSEVSTLLFAHYPITAEQVVGHSDIAPGRKTDPGPAFDWVLYQQNLAKSSLPS
ncbi:putative signalling protein in beta-lactamaseregulation [Yersinia enterocolitica (type O:9) str. YE212/02]|nr:putative signalling protein in beta-lactamaseregulation [Yersinia enterocolitica (type O:9) str. YE212/02]CCV36488.1 putative signalling protein in beta-lactamaseregulation [Yersinia enterocolitica (type O:9) str. YE56/03]CCV44375.1 putative signalling protein in beta-lactamaseregulation [Yersinia enterocolitica (type O:5,27) str. YE149/02]CCV54756.1 putative signalling protein in beta-lactamaseregulation [Yersinia enterocolitica (type O:3) str. YE12/03]